MDHNNNYGSATVEACVIVPVFLFFLLEISYIFMMVMADAHIHQSLAEASIYGAQYCYLEDRISSASILNTVVINKQFRTYLGEDSMVDKVVAGGKNGIVITAVPEIDNPKVFNVRADYVFQISVPVLGSHYIKRSEYIKQKAYLGYSKEDAVKDLDIYVYITPNQSVYHLSRSCTHLALKVRTRSGHGSYPPCGFCGKDEYIGTVYVAESGTVYHNNPRCIGLKRTVSRVKKSSVAGLGPCSRCGQ